MSRTGRIIQALLVVFVVEVSSQCSQQQSNACPVNQVCALNLNGGLTCQQGCATSPNGCPSGQSCVSSGGIMVCQSTASCNPANLQACTTGKICALSPGSTTAYSCQTPQLCSPGASTCAVGSQCVFSLVASTYICQAPACNPSQVNSCPSGQTCQIPSSGGTYSCITTACSPYTTNTCPTGQSCLLSPSASPTSQTYSCQAATNAACNPALPSCPSGQACQLSAAISSHTCQSWMFCNPSAVATCSTGQTCTYSPASGTYVCLQIQCNPQNPTTCASGQTCSTIQGVSYCVSTPGPSCGPATTGSCSSGQSCTYSALIGQYTCNPNLACNPGGNACPTGQTCQPGTNGGYVCTSIPIATCDVTPAICTTGQSCVYSGTGYVCQTSQTQTQTCTPAAPNCSPSTVCLPVVGTQQYTCQTVGAPVALPVSQSPSAGAQGTPWSFNAASYFQSSLRLSFSLPNAPQGSGLTIDPSSGVISGTPTATDVQRSPYTLNVQASSSSGTATIQLSLRFTAPTPPVGLTIPSTSIPRAVVGTPWTFDVSSYVQSRSSLTYTIIGAPTSSLRISASGVLTAIFTAADAALPQPVTVLVNAADASRQSTVVSFSLNILQPAAPVVITSTGSIPTAYTTQPYSLNAAQFFASSSTLRFSILNPRSGSGLTINPTTGVISGQPTMVDLANSPLSINVQADDGRMGISQVTIPITVVQPVAPTVTPPAPGTVPPAYLNTQYSYNAAVNFKSTNTLSYSIQGLPPTSGFQINPFSGLITGYPTASDLAQSPVTFLVLANDGKLGVAQTTLSIQVLQAPSAVTVTVPSSALPPAATVGVTYSYSAGSLFPGGQGPLTFSIQNPLFGSGFQVSSSTGVVGGVPTAQDQANSPVSVTIMATDTKMNTWKLPLSITVNAAKAPSVTPTTSLTSATQGSPYYFNMASGFTSANGAVLQYKLTGLPQNSGFSFNPSTGILSGSANGIDQSNSPLNLCVLATDTNTGMSSSYCVSLAVQQNVSPVASTIPSATAKVGQYFYLSVAGAFSSPSNDALTYSISPALPDGSGLTFSTSAGTLSGTPANSLLNLVQPMQITVTAANPYGLKVSSVLQLTITLANPPPVSKTIPTQNAVVGQQFSLKLNNYFSSSLTLTYQVQGAPTAGTGLGLNPTTGLFQGVPTTNDLTASQGATLTVTARDTTGATAQQTFLFIVSPAPMIPKLSSPIPSPATATVGLQFMGYLASHFSSPDPTDKLTYAISGLPASTGMSFDPTTGVLSGTPKQADATASPIAVTVTATGKAGSATGTFVLAVTPAPQPPVARAIPAKTATQGTAFSVATKQFFTPPTSDTTLRYTMTGLPTGTGLRLAPVTGILSGTPTLADVSSTPWSVVITATTPAGNSAKSTMSLTVYANLPGPTANQIPNQIATVGVSFTLALSSLFKPVTGLTYTLSGLPPGSGMQLDSTAKTLTGAANAVDRASQPLSLSVIATDVRGKKATATFYLTVVDAFRPPQATAVPPASCYVNIACEVDYSSYFTSPDKFPLAFSATGLPGSLTMDPSTGRLLGTPTSADASKPQPLLITLTATDPQGQKATTTAAVTIAPKFLPPTLQAIPPSTATVGTTFVYDVSNSYTDPQGLLLVYSLSTNPTRSAFSIGASTGVITGVPAPADCAPPQPIQMLVTATNSQGMTSTGRFFLTIKCDSGSSGDCSGGATASVAAAIVGQYFSDDISNQCIPSGVTVQGYTIKGLPLGTGLGVFMPGRVSGVPTVRDCQANQPLSPTISADDGMNIVASFPIYISVACSASGSTVTLPTLPPTAPPTLSPGYIIVTAGLLPTQYATQGTQFSFDMTMVFLPLYPSQYQLIYRVSGIPLGSGLSFDSIQGLLQGTIDDVDCQNSPLKLVLSAADGKGWSLSKQLQISVANCGSTTASSSRALTLSGTTNIDAGPTLTAIITPPLVAGRTTVLDLSKFFTTLTSPQPTTYSISGLAPGSGVTVTSDGKLVVNPSPTDCVADNTDASLPPITVTGSQGANEATYPIFFNFDCGNVTFNRTMMPSNTLGLPQAGDSISIDLIKALLLPPTPTSALPIFSTPSSATSTVAPVLTRSYKLSGLPEDSGIQITGTGVLVGKLTAADCRDATGNTLPLSIEMGGDIPTKKVNLSLGLSCGGNGDSSEATPLTTVDSSGTRPVNLGVLPANATAGQPFFGDLRPYFVGSDDSPLSFQFSQTSLPSGTGLSTSSAGVIVGVPTTQDLAAKQPLSISFTVSSSSMPLKTTAIFQLTITTDGSVALKPRINSKIAASFKATVGVAFSANLTKLFISPMPGGVLFLQKGLPRGTGLRLSPQGVLLGTPTSLDPATLQLTITVINSLGLSVQRSVTITVGRTTTKPGVQATAKPVAKISTCARLGWNSDLVGSPTVCAGIPQATVRCPLVARTASDASAACINFGARLCAAEEVSDEAKNLPCGLNQSRVWTASPCPGGFVTQGGSLAALRTMPQRCDPPTSTFQFFCCATTNSATVDAPLSSPLPLAPISVYFGRLFSYATGALFTSPTGGLTFSLAGAPSLRGLSIDSSAGIISGFPRPSADDVGGNVQSQATLVVRATDAKGNLATKALPFLFRPNPTGGLGPRVVSAIPTVSAFKGEAMVASLAFAFADIGPLSFSIHGLPEGTGLRLDAGSGLLVGSPSSADAAMAQTLAPLLATITATNLNGFSTNASFFIIISGQGGFVENPTEVVALRNQVSVRPIGSQGGPAIVPLHSWFWEPTQQGLCFRAQPGSSLGVGAQILNSGYLLLNKLPLSPPLVKAEAWSNAQSQSAPTGSTTSINFTIAAAQGSPPTAIGFPMDISLRPGDVLEQNVSKWFQGQGLSYFLHPNSHNFSTFSLDPRTGMLVGAPYSTTASLLLLGLYATGPRGVAGGVLRLHVAGTSTTSANSANAGTQSSTQSTSQPSQSTVFNTVINQWNFFALSTPSTAGASSLELVGLPSGSGLQWIREGCLFGIPTAADLLAAQTAAQTAAMTTSTRSAGPAVVPTLTVGSSAAPSAGGPCATPIFPLTLKSLQPQSTVYVAFEPGNTELALGALRNAQSVRSVQCQVGTLCLVDVLPSLALPSISNVTYMVGALPAGTGLKILPDVGFIMGVPTVNDLHAQPLNLVISLRSASGVDILVNPLKIRLSITTAIISRV